MTRVNRDKYFTNEGKELVDEILRRNASLERRISDLERALANQDTPPPIPRIDPDTYPEPYEGQRAIDITDEQHTWYSDGEWRKAAAGGGIAVWELKAFEDWVPVVTGDGRFIWEVPEDLDGSEIVAVEAYVTTPSSSGTIQLQMRKLTNGAPPGSDFLSTKIFIDANERNSKDAATQPVISGGTVLVAHGDHIAVDVDNAGSGAMGLGVIVVCTPSPLGSLAITGATGPPGGVDEWTGQWTTSTSYTEGQSVSNNGSSYVAIVDHTSGAASEPGVGVDWEDFWQLLSEGKSTSAIEVVINGNGHVLDPGVKAYVEVPFDCQIDEVVMLADQAGNVQVDIWKDTYSNYPPVNADSITSASPPAIVAGNKSIDSALSGWTVGLSAGDILAFNVDSCSVITIVAVSLKVLR